MFGFKARKQARSDERAQSDYLQETFDYMVARKAIHMNKRAWPLSAPNAENEANRECKIVYPFDNVHDYLASGRVLRSSLSPQQFSGSPYDEVARLKFEDDEALFWGGGFFSDLAGQR